MGKSDANNLLNIAIGAVVGAIISSFIFKDNLAYPALTSRFGPVSFTRSRTPITPANRGGGSGGGGGGGGGSHTTTEKVNVTLTALPGCDCICQPANRGDNYNPKKWKMATDTGEACDSTVYSSSDECVTALDGVCSQRGGAGADAGTDDTEFTSAYARLTIA